MSERFDLILIGASVRAAAFSALRAGMRPWCMDLFGDADLRRYCLSHIISAKEYPKDLPKFMAEAPPVPWLYTGALENHPRIVSKLAKMRPLWGNDESVLKLVRDPLHLSDILYARGIPHPDVAMHLPNPLKRRWLRKNRHSAGGRGIEFCSSDRPLSRRRQKQFFQSYTDGTPYAAIFLGAGNHTRLLGVTRQLIGERWLHARPFAYCGSIGPISLPAAVQHRFERIGQALVETMELRGLFGVDVVVQDEIPNPVEVNPRYTASVEVLEYAVGTPMLHLHRNVFDQDYRTPPALGSSRKNAMIGKGVLFAPRQLVIPDKERWEEGLKEHFDPWRLPEYADIPKRNTKIMEGAPVISLFVRGQDETECFANLQEKANRLIHLHT